MLVTAPPPPVSTANDSTPCVTQRHAAVCSGSSAANLTALDRQVSRLPRQLHRPGRSRRSRRSGQCSAPRTTADRRPPAPVVLAVLTFASLASLDSFRSLGHGDVEVIDPLSRCSQAWGGDETARRVRRLPSRHPAFAGRDALRAALDPAEYGSGRGRARPNGPPERAGGARRDALTERARGAVEVPRAG